MFYLFIYCSSNQTKQNKKSKIKKCSNCKLTTKCLRKELFHSVFCCHCSLDSISALNICNTCNCQSPFSVPLFGSSPSRSLYCRLILNDNNQNWLLCLPFPSYTAIQPIRSQVPSKLQYQMHIAPSIFLSLSSHQKYHFYLFYILLFIFIAIFVLSHCPLYYTLFLLCCHQ